MKRIILLLLMTLCMSVCFGQRSFRDYLNQYEVVDSLPLERISIHFNKEVDNEDFINMGDGDYLAPLPHKDKMIIKTNSDKTKAVVLYNSYCFGRHLEFNVEENERRMILWFKDKNLYCGYIYDKTYKVCKYFESKREFKRFTRRPIFNKPL